MEEGEPGGLYVECGGKVEDARLIVGRWMIWKNGERVSCEKGAPRWALPMTQDRVA